MAEGRISVWDMPHLIFMVRVEMAKMLKTEAGRETNPEFAKKLRTLAARFEVGTDG